MSTNRHPVSQAPLPERTRPYWLEVRWYIETIWALFQGPEAIAACHAMARGEYNLLASWLRQAEAFARRVLLADALDVKIDAPKKTKRKSAPNTSRQVESFDPDDSHTWRAPFRLTENEKHYARMDEPKGQDFILQGGSEPSRKKYNEVRFPDCRNLARRFEALCRVWDAPELYVKRLARLIKKTPKAINAFLQPIAFQTAMDAVFEALRQFNDERRLARASDTS